VAAAFVPETKVEVSLDAPAGLTTKKEEQEEQEGVDDFLY
jgi:hypothetical protein